MCFQSRGWINRDRRSLGFADQPATLPYIPSSRPMRDTVSKGEWYLKLSSGLCVYTHVYLHTQARTHT